MGGPKPDLKLSFWSLKPLLRGFKLGLGGLKPGLGGLKTGLRGLESPNPRLGASNQVLGSLGFRALGPLTWGPAARLQRI